MKRYRFSLESALRARRAQEDVARQRLAEANHRVQQAWAAHSEAVAIYERSPSGSSGPIDTVAFAAERDSRLRLAATVERARRVAVELEVEAATHYAAWVEAGKQVASLERLDERRRAEWQAEALREEATAVDDVVASRWTSAVGAADRGAEA